MSVSCPPPPPPLACRHTHTHRAGLIINDEALLLLLLLCPPFPTSSKSRFRCQRHPPHLIPLIVLCDARRGGESPEVACDDHPWEKMVSGGKGRKIFARPFPNFFSPPVFREEKRRVMWAEDEGWGGRDPRPKKWRRGEEEEKPMGTVVAAGPNSNPQ